RERRHAVPVREAQQQATALWFAVANRMNAGIEQGEAGDPARRPADDFERDPASHGMSRDREALGRGREHMVGHGRYGRESAKRHDPRLRHVPEALRDVRPKDLVAQQSGQEQKGLLQWGVLVIYSVSL